jgi:diadenosine tetraphosphate (Ap4A) HIT family hydrolase
MLTFETSITLPRLVKEATGCDKINVGALGNQVRQFHLHMIARVTRTDPAWPGPVWGHGKALNPGRRPLSHSLRIASPLVQCFFKPCRTIHVFPLYPKSEPC